MSTKYLMCMCDINLKLIENLMLCFWLEGNLEVAGEQRIGKIEIFKLCIPKNHYFECHCPIIEIKRERKNKKIGWETICQPSTLDSNLARHKQIVFFYSITMGRKTLIRQRDEIWKYLLSMVDVYLIVKIIHVTYTIIWLFVSCIK